MTERKWMRIGLKLIGIYFAVLGIGAVWGEIIMILTTPRNVVKAHSIVIGGLLQPAAYLVMAALLLLKTGPIIDWCLRDDGFRDRDGEGHESHN